MSTEKQARTASGWLMLAVTIALFVAAAAMMIGSIVWMVTSDGAGIPIPGAAGALFVASIVMICGASLLCSGFFTIQPGQARVCVLFGNYAGTERTEGLRWANPFYSHSLGSTDGKGLEVDASKGKFSWGRSNSKVAKISVRTRTLNGDRPKVNDKMGNPIEIASMVVWHVEDTARAVFDVDDYESYVFMQSETALRHVASVYAYDHLEDDSDASGSITLRSNIEEVSDALKAELPRTLAPAGVAVDDARLTHLAYAPEIAQAMLRRQQAEAVIAARKKIVEGAVSMVDMAVRQLSDSAELELDDERKAAMASNLMVVLCGESEAQPVLNTGTLYQ